jgi:hypothetical protein
MSRFGRLTSRKPVRAEEPEGELDEEVWRQLTGIIAAGTKGDGNKLARLWLRLERELSDRQRKLAGVYVWYLVQYCVAQILQRSPTAGDLHDLAVRGDPKFAQLIRAGEVNMEKTLRSVFQFASPDQQVTGGQLYIAGSAAVSALLSDPAALEAIRGPLSRWYARNATTLTDLGILATPATLDP